MSQKTDIWSFAAVCLELLLRTPNFAKQLSEKEFAEAALGNDFSENEISRWIKDIQQKMIEWVYLMKKESKSEAVENLNKELREKYPKMMQMLKVGGYQK